MLICEAGGSEMNSKVPESRDDVLDESVTVRGVVVGGGLFLDVNFPKTSRACFLSVGCASVPFDPVSVALVCQFLYSFVLRGLVSCCLVM